MPTDLNRLMSAPYGAETLEIKGGGIIDAIEGGFVNIPDNQTLTGVPIGPDGDVPYHKEYRCAARMAWEEMNGAKRFIGPSFHCKTKEKALAALALYLKKEAGQFIAVADELEAKEGPCT